MKWLWIAFPLYMVYYTVTYAKIVWDEGNKLGGIFITLLAVATMAAGVWKFFS